MVTSALGLVYLVNWFPVLGAFSSDHCENICNACDKKENLLELRSLTAKLAERAVNNNSDPADSFTMRNH